MTINQNNTFGALDSSDSSAMDAANQFNPALSGSAMSTSPYVSGSNVAGAAYSPTAGTDQDSFDTSDSSGGAPAWLKNLNAQQLVDYSQQAGRWIRSNPNAAVAIGAGLVAAVFGYLAVTQASGRRRGNLYQYPNGQTYGQPYGNESVTYDPATHTETIHAAGNAGYDNTGL
ncbi:MAG: hypothetical protein ICV83_00515 [Cytophagales bacterium]|nr:hypothetical protein [Cytophagales bacterium]